MKLQGKLVNNKKKNDVTFYKDHLKEIEISWRYDRDISLPRMVLSLTF